MKPRNSEEAIEYLSNKNGLNQHIFYPKSKNRNKCEICGDIEKNHIKEYEKSIKTQEKNSQLDFSFVKEIKLKEKNFFSNNNKCEICLELIEKEEFFECEKCKFNFCKECLFKHFETLIKEQKEIICANSKCQYKYKEKIILSILSKYCKDIKEFNQLKNTYEKIKIKFLVLSKPDLIFCPIPDCNGYAKKGSDCSRYICNHGHAFCYRCREYWHEDGNCPKDKAVDELFENFVNKLNIKRCPTCRIYTIKGDGCNHIKCTQCKAEWCFLCGELFRTTQEHYENPKSPCFQRMNEGIIQLDICLICETPTDNRELINFRKCNHLICKNCLLSYFNGNPSIEVNKHINIKCPIEGCNNITSFDNSNEIIELLKK